MMQDQATEWADDCYGTALPASGSDLEQMVRQLEDICEEPLPAGWGSESDGALFRNEV